MRKVTRWPIRDEHGKSAKDYVMEKCQQLEKEYERSTLEDLFFLGDDKTLNFMQYERWR